MTHSDRNLGARQIDIILFELFSKEFDKKTGCDISENPRARLRMLDGIEKMRKLLSGNKEAEINLECLMDDMDFRKMMKRSDFEAIIAPTFSQNLEKVLYESLARSNLNPKHIDFVELVGEATRIPIVQEIIKKVFHKQELSRTLNSQDCIARGCAL